MIIKTPTKFFLASGEGEGKTVLTAFDDALLNAGIANTNLLKLTSILPPGCCEVLPQELPPGAIVPIVYAFKSSFTPGELISSVVGVGISEDAASAGLLMEYSHVGEKQVAEEIVRNMVKEGFGKRGWKLKEIKIASAQHKVINIGAVCAAVVLWD